MTKRYQLLKIRKDLKVYYVSSITELKESFLRELGNKIGNASVRDLDSYRDDMQPFIRQFNTTNPRSLPLRAILSSCVTEPKNWNLK